VSRLTMAFLGALILFLLGFLLVLLDGTTAAEPTYAGPLTRLTRLPRASFSAGWLEPPVPAYRDAAEEVFPGMRPINYQDFVHAR